MVKAKRTHEMKKRRVNHMSEVSKCETEENITLREKEQIHPTTKYINKIYAKHHEVD